MNRYLAPRYFAVRYFGGRAQGIPVSRYVSYGRSRKRPPRLRLQTVWIYRYTGTGGLVLGGAAVTRFDTSHAERRRKLKQMAHYWMLAA